MVWIEKLMYLASSPVVRTYIEMMLNMDVQRLAAFPKGSKIIAANHPSTTDPFFVAGILKQQSFILIKDVLFEVPLLGTYLRHSGHIPVCVGSGPAAIQAALERLAQGKTVVIFPEGDLSPVGGGFHKARTGVARLALASGAPVIPVGIHLQTERIHTVKSTVRGKVEYGRWYLRGPYSVTVGQPLHYSGDVENRELVRSVASSVMHHIIEMARESEIRMDRTNSLNGLPQTL